MAKTLIRHPQSRCAAVTRIGVEAARRTDMLVLRYSVTGATSGLRLPPAAAPERRDELWRQTCFEAFLRAGSGEAYYEFNFAPSTCWAAYEFDGYRTGMRPVEDISVPDIEIRCSGECLELSTVIKLDGLHLPRGAAWRLGLSAVIEEMDGAKSYWALAHPPDQPDFHHSDCFALELAPTWRP